MSLSGLAQINLELTSRCSKSTLCAFCGHQDAAINPNLRDGDMDFSLLESIRSQLAPGITIQFHRDGEPTDYIRLADALRLFSGFVTSLVTHGERLIHCADAIIGRCTSVTVSVFRGDPDGPMQYDAVKEFLRLKGDAPPQVLIKIVGDMSDDELEPYGALDVPILRRLIHHPAGNAKYAHRLPTMPEVGICLDFLHHPSVDWRGHVYICNRLSPQGEGCLGSLREHTLDELWNGETRRGWLEAHKRGRRDLASPLCKDCLYWGVPSAWQPQAVRVNLDDLIQVQ